MTTDQTVAAKTIGHLITALDRVPIEAIFDGTWWDRIDRLPKETQPMNRLRAIWERIKNEPVLVGTAIVAVGNVLGFDASAVAEIVQSLILFVVGLGVRAKVTPVRKLLR